MKRQLKNSVSIAALAIAAGLGMSATAVAADYTAPAPYVPPPLVQFNWQAFYIGAHFGFGQANYDGCAFRCPASDSSVHFDQLDLTGMLGGLHFGYNWDHGGPLVWGLEADVSFMDWDDRAFAADSSENAVASVDMLASVRGRLGFVTGDDRSGLLYLTGGVAFADADATIFDSAPPTSTQGVDLGDVGGVFGVGFELAHTDNFRLRAETLYYIFDDSAAITLASADAGDFISFDDAWVLRLGGSYYLN